ncbi:MAG: tRNA (cytidine(56)-2'-O)-methyltransferase [Candidatus Bathyarchaeota archaeon]|nr:tRNA (cytidine(56)-2'-O)-methyltransferase [Candidatus Bathyarchaeota archaeon]MDH5494783.1 tRNA (cytidine(56)-2'-O)-methyltransferase [Candidatus Bathyarchaeota archaeon]
MKLPKVVVLRWGHRLRDERLTTHVALTARALGASGIILTDVEDEKIKKTIDEVVKNWGGFFFFQMGTPWKKALKDWRAKGGVVVHLTAYGENIQTSNVIQRIQAAGKDVLVIVGSQKVPSEFFSKEISDFDIAVGNQPHSECSSLAVFLDRYFEGNELEKTFKKARLQIVPQKYGKKVVSKK